MRWDTEGPLQALLRNVETSIKDYEKAGSEVREAHWIDVLNAVDALIAEGERIHGSRIKSSASGS